MKQIPLSQGLFALVDDEDFEYLNQFKWHARKSRDTFYASRNLKISKNNRKTIQMHRVILGTTDTKIQGDHIDGNGLNNQKSNLREATHEQNRRNTKSYKNGVSKYKGVSYRKDSKKWRSIINFNKKVIRLGYFSSEIEAAKAYDVKAKELFGEFAWLNFK